LKAVPSRQTREKKKFARMAEVDWKSIQERTFTKWFNSVLVLGGPSNGQITSLRTDLKDGLKLVQLLEILTQKRFERIKKQPTCMQQELENLTIVFKYLKNEAKVKKVDMIGKPDN
jgi:hypothetical protein